LSERESSPPPSFAPFGLAVLLFFFSGASGLVYQVIWLRLLTRIFGSTTFAVSALLAAFMAGLGLGSFLASRALPRVRHPLRWFGALEIGIGLYALAFNALLPAIERLFLGLVSSFELTSAGESLVKVVLSFALLVPPTTLMGASLPLLVQRTVAELKSMGLRTGALYSVNTLGAAFGCFAAGFYAIPHFGMETTTRLAALVNGIVGLTGIGLSFLFPAALPGDGTESGSESESERSPDLRWAMAAFGLSGFAAIGLEVVWTRLFTLVLKGYTYSFTAMLTVLLLGIASGSAVFGHRADRSRDLPGLLGVLQIAIGVSVLSLTALLVLAEGAQVYLRYGFGYDWKGHTLSNFLVSLLVLGVPTFLFGAQFPVVARIATEEARRAGSRVGSLYAMNVFGSITGALVTGYVLIPFAGTEASLRLLAGSMTGMGILLVVIRSARSAGAKRALALSGAMALAVALLATPRDLSRRIHEGWLLPGESLSHYEEGATATVMVSTFPPAARADKRILINGSSASNSNEYGLSVNRVQGGIPFLFENGPRRVLATCFGTGITFGTLGQFDVERIDGVDISPEVIRAAGEFGVDNYDVIENPRVRIHIDDGRNFLLKSPERYDVITMEPMPPALAGVSDMYTREFYALCREHLSPGGMMSQWVPLYFLTLDDVKMLYRTFADAFPYVMVFHFNFDTFLVGSNEPLRLAPEAYERRVRVTSDRLRRDLAAINLGEPAQMFGTFLMSRAEMLAFAGDVPLVTDDLPLVEFTGPKAEGMSTTPTNYLAVTKFARPVTSELDPARLSPGLRETLDSDFEAKRSQWEQAREQADRRAR
jgi:spermidine synthase